MYYTMKRHDLIRLLSMPELPESYKLEKITIVQLRDQAKEKGLRGFWTLSRSELLALLYPPLPSKEKNDDRNQEDEHEDPKAQDPNNVGVCCVKEN